MFQTLFFNYSVYNTSFVSSFKKKRMPRMGKQNCNALQLSLICYKYQHLVIIESVWQKVWQHITHTQKFALLNFFPIKLKHNKTCSKSFSIIFKIKLFLVIFSPSCYWSKSQSSFHFNGKATCQFSFLRWITCYEL